MTLPDIIREAKIISGKEQLPLYKEQILAMASGLTASSNFDSHEKLDSCSQMHRNKHNLRGKTSHVDQGYFPNLIFNNGTRSTSYTRNTRSRDFINSKNSPLATRLIYNWKPVERESAKSVQSRLKVYKPQKRMDVVARPSSPYRVKSDWETVVPHFHNEKRTIEMKRMQYLKEHTGWSVYPYGSVDEKEDYK